MKIQNYWRIKINMKYKNTLKERVDNYLFKCKNLLFKKRIEYNPDDNEVFNNIDFVAKAMGCSREEHLLHLMMKHMASIVHLVEKMNDPDISQDQYKEIGNMLLNDKLTDSINYSLLIALALQERLDSTSPGAEPFSWYKRDEVIPLEGRVQ